MNGAAFFLAVNFIVAASFSAVFVVVARHSRSRTGALRVGAGFGVASLSAICELLVAYTSFPKLAAIAAFATVLVGMTMLAAGICELYGKRLPRWIPIIFCATGLCLAYLIYDLPRGTPQHAFLYQAPFAVVILTVAISVLPFRN